MYFSHFYGLVQFSKTVLPVLPFLRFPVFPTFFYSLAGKKIFLQFYEKTIDFMGFPRYNVFLREEKTNGL